MKKVLFLMKIVAPLIISIIMILNSHAMVERIPIHQRLRNLDYTPEHRSFSHFNAKIKSVQEVQNAFDDQSKVLNYTHNEYGFRIYPELKSKKIKQHIILSGCSFTYGNALSNTHTFPFQLGSKIDGAEVINMGLPGAATKVHIFLWEHYDFKKLIKEPSGTMVYTVFNDHINRANNNWSYLVWAPHSAPVYENINGKWVLTKEISELFSYKWIQLLKIVNLSGAWLKLTSFFELLNRERDIDAFVSQIAYFQDLYLKQFPNGKFIVSEMAPVMALTRPKDRAYFIKTLKEKGITFWINHSVSAQQDYSEYLINGDGHPNAKLNKVYADFLISKLKVSNQNSSD